jgi:hypothetical protein
MCDKENIVGFTPPERSRKEAQDIYRNQGNKCHSICSDLHVRCERSLKSPSINYRDISLTFYLTETPR